MTEELTPSQLRWLRRVLWPVAIVFAIIVSIPFYAILLAIFSPMIAQEVAGLARTPSAAARGALADVGRGPPPPRGRRRHAAGRAGAEGIGPGVLGDERRAGSRL